MKLKILFLFFALTFNAFQIVSAAVDIKKEEKKEITESSENHNEFIFSKKELKRAIKKKRKFRLRNLFKWKRLKKAKQTEDKKKPEVFAYLGGFSTIFALVLLLSNLVSPYVLLLVILGGIFGIIGLKRIRNKPGKRSGEFLAWIGIVGMILLIIGLFLVVVFNRLDFL